MQKNIVVAVVMSAVVFGGAGYMLGQKSTGSTIGSPAASGTARGNFAGGTGRGARAGGGGMVGGEIIAKDSTSITVKLRGTQTDGSAGSKIIFLSAATQVTKSAQGSTTDLSVGTQVTAFGSPNPDGSMSAQSVQIRPELPPAMERATTSSASN